MKSRCLRKQVRALVYFLCPLLEYAPLEERFVVLGLTQRVQHNFWRMEHSS